MDFTHKYIADIWTVNELIDKVGSVDKMAALRALTTWVDLGVLKEEDDEQFRLLNVAEDASSSSRIAPSRSGETG